MANSVGDTSVGTITVNITGQNDAPILITPAPAPATIVEDSGTLTLDAGTYFLPGPSGETGTVRFNSANPIPTAQGTVSIVNGQLVFEPRLNFFGDVNVVVTAIDNDQAISTAATITIRVTPDNDPPVATTTRFATNEDVAITLSPAQLFSTGPANESDQSISLSNPALESGSTGLSFSFSPTGQLIVTPASNFFGNNVVFSVDGTDNGSPAKTVRGTFTIDIASVNDAPTATNDNFVVQSFTGTEQELNVLANDLAGPNEPNSDLRITRVFGQTGTGTIRIAADANQSSIFHRQASQPAPIHSPTRLAIPLTQQ